MSARLDTALSGRRDRILVADDDPTTRLLIAATLTQAGFEVDVAEDGLAALGLYHTRKPGLVLLDVEMPGADGFQVCAMIRRDEAGSHRQVPLVMITGMDDLNSVTSAYEAGATDFISKPINLPSLAHRVQYILRASQAADGLRVAEAHNRAMLSAIPDLMLRLNGAADVIGGAPGQPTADLSAGVLAAALRGEVRRCLDTRALTTCEFEVNLAGEVQHYEARLAPTGPDELLALIRDISERKLAEERIRTLAYRDTLTGMLNRQGFLDALQSEIRAHADHTLALLFMDLDGFKRVNDLYGHVLGDKLLQAVAARLQEGLKRAEVQVRLGDRPQLGRLGGDEFTLLLPRVRDPGDAMQVGQIIKDLLHQSFLIDQHEVSVSASIGISHYPTDGSDAIVLLKCADTAMYHAKDIGRNNFQVYSAALTTRIHERVSLENSLRKALERDEFALVYQPQIALPERRIVGVEALLRWNHPERGRVSPLEFIPVAEETHLILPIGQWVLETACRQAAAWRRMGFTQLRMGVNLSAVQFRERGLLHSILRILAETGLASEQLELELTESALMDNADTTIQALRRIHQAGIHVAIDDFGTGYSSISYLKQFPVGTLKIDRSFIRDLPHDRENRAITRAIIAMADSLGLRVLAEGIETAEQAADLQRLGCQLQQGFHFARPMAADDITVLLQQASGLLQELPAASL